MTKAKKYLTDVVNPKLIKARADIDACGTVQALSEIRAAIPHLSKEIRW